MADLTRRIYPQVTPDGSLVFHSLLSDERIEIRAACILPPEEIIPIVFLPGIMGSRLIRTGKEETWAWTPPEGGTEKAKAAWDYSGKTPGKRQWELDPDNTRLPEEKDAPPVSKVAKDASFFLTPADKKTWEAQARWRGWGEIYNDCYFPVMVKMEAELNHMVKAFEKGEPLVPYWGKLLLNQVESKGIAAVIARNDNKSIGKMGAQKPLRIPVEEDLRRVASRAWFPVHACGYNWLKSNQEAATRLKKKVEEWLQFYSKIKSRGKRLKCEKVILVTHSMGGLVARLATQDPGFQEKVLGVVHGVMPAVGAPATYKRMRSGCEGAAQIILGRNAAECTAVMAYAAGPLELLPFPGYDPDFRPQEVPAAPRDAAKPRHWLLASCQSPGPNGWQTAWRALGNGDFMNSIYLPNDERVWYRLVKANLLNPARREELQKVEADLEKCGKTIDDQSAEDIRKGNSTELGLKNDRNLQQIWAALLARHKELQEKLATLKKEEADAPRKDFEKFLEVMQKVKSTQAKLPVAASSYHPNTYAFYEADAGLPTWNEVCWEYHPVVSYALSSNKPASKEQPNRALVGTLPASNLADRELADDLNGRLTIEVNRIAYHFVMAPAAGAGDGTVPEASGATPTAFCQQVFRHTGQAGHHPSYEHQDAFKAGIGIDVTLYSIIRMAVDYVKK